MHREGKGKGLDKKVYLWYNISRKNAKKTKYKKFNKIKGDIMTEAAKEARNKYKREWRKNNPEKVRAANERYWAKKALEQMKKETNSEQGADYAQRA